MTQSKNLNLDVLIAGQGAAGFAAGLYAARYQMKTAIDKNCFEKVMQWFVWLHHHINSLFENRCLKESNNYASSFGLT